MLADRSFYEDVLSCVTYEWQNNVQIGHKLRKFGWQPRIHDIKRMLHLLGKHKKITLMRSRTYYLVKLNKNSNLVTTENKDGTEN